MNVKKAKTTTVTDSLVVKKLINIIIIIIVVIIIVMMMMVMSLSTQGEGDNCPKVYNANQLDSDKDGEYIIHCI